MNVLVVEDNVSARKLLVITFMHYGCTVFEAQDGVEGLEQAARHKPDIIISDALMPRMDGFQLLRAIKADPELKSIPFIFYSSTYTGEKEAELAIALGAEAFVAKPIEPDELWKKTCFIMEEWEARQKTPAHPTIDSGDEQYLREYSRVVATKLEEKVAQLEEVLAQREKTENALKEREQELATIFENAPYVMLLLDRDRRVRKSNAQACAFTGLQDSEMINRRNGEALHCVHAIDTPEGCGFGPYCLECIVRRTIMDTFETGQSHLQVETSLLLSIQEKEKAVQALFSTTKILVANQEMVLFSLQDISEYKTLEAQFRQVQKMESIGTLAGGIAHDFNNLLTVIIGYGQMSIMKMTDDDPLRHNIEQILASAERAVHLTRDLLLFSRKHVSDKKIIDLNQVIRSLEKFLLRIIGEDVACTLTLREGKIAVFADDHQLEQVLLNLAANARDAMPNGGTLSIATERVRLDKAFITKHGYGTCDTYALLTLTDNGEGMDEETARKIYDPFFTTKEVGKGTGLGMSVVYGIVKKHDGYITVSSEIGRGTTFSIYLPLTEPKDIPEATVTNHEQPLGGNETILIAEDDEAIREMAISLLQGFGYEIISAVDGDDAVIKFLEHRERIQLLLLDVIMPKKNGNEVYNEIRKIEPAIKVIFASGYALDALRQKVQLDESAPLIVKPYVPVKLLASVRSVLDSKQYADMS